MAYIRIEPANRFVDDATGIVYEDRGPVLGMVPIGYNGAAVVNGAPGNLERITAATFTGACNGCRILTIGTGTLTLSPTSGDTDIVVTAAELTAMGVNAYQDWIARCDSITAGTGMSVLIYK